MSYEYQKLLESEDWQRKRESILIRDGLICKNCQNTFLEDDSQIGYYLHPCMKTNYISFHDLDYQFYGRYITYAIGAKLPYAAIIFFQGEDPKCPKIKGIRAMYAQEFEYFNTQILNSDKSEKQGLSIKPIPFKHKFIAGYNWIHVKGLHVHHTYYQFGKNPWEYPDSALETYCYKCHFKLHENKKVPVLDSNHKLINHFTPCKRCAGAGWLQEYKHVKNGVCFECNGARYKELMHE